MSAPARPTLVKKAEEADSARILRSAARAMTAPAPAATPLTAAITGTGSRRILSTTAPVARELEKAPGVHLQQQGDYLVHVPTGAEASPGAGDDQGANVVAMLYLPEQVPQVCVDVESEGIELVGAVEGDRPHTVCHLEPEVLPAVGEACRSAKWAHRARRLTGRLKSNAGDQRLSVRDL